MIQPALTLLAILGAALLMLIGNRLAWEAPGTPLAVSAEQNADLLNLTGTAARLAGENDLRTVVSYAQTIYAAAQDKDRPGAVLLVRDDDPATAMAATRLQHFPVNAPMLYVTEAGTVLPKETKDELERLGPEGVMMDRNVQVYIVGAIDPVVGQEVRDMGLATREIYAADPVAFTEVLDEYLAVLDGDHQDVVLVASLDALEYAYGGANWNAHMGTGWAFVSRDGIPPATRRILERRTLGGPYIYVFAPPDVVGQAVMAELSRYGHVQRIPGDTPQEMAVRWAGYKDVGQSYGFWYGKKTRNVGWGYAEPGHNLLVANPANWRTIIPSGVLSHMGKHAMLILTDEDGTLPGVAQSYLRVLQPSSTHPSQQVFTFAWILGVDVPDQTMRQVSELIAPVD
jgi:hypothetical protein